MEKRVKEYLQQAILHSAIQYRKHFDPVTGRFMQDIVMTAEGRKEPEEGKGWAITHQDPVLAYAYLYKTDCPDNPFYRDPATFDMILKAVQAWRDWQYEDGRMEFIKVNGETWGPTFMCWSWYHWLETYILLCDDLTAAIKADWEKGLYPGLENFGKQDPEIIHNISVWQAMCVHRAGQHFGRQDWINSADKLLANACKMQHPDGFWPEHKGPTTLYNKVYLYALGMYYAHGGKVDVLPALRRGTAFMQAFTYPSGADLETVDGRVHYHGVQKGTLTEVTALPGYTVTKAGIAYMNQFLHCYSQEKIDLARTTATILALESIGEERRDGYEGLAGFSDRNFISSYGSATIVRKDNNQITLSAYTAPVTESRWGMDRQFFASVWTEDADLLMGNSNSKNQIECSTFIISDQNGEMLSYIPTAGKVVKDGMIALDYNGYAICELEGSISDEGKMTLIYTAKLTDPSYHWRVSLPLFVDFDMEKSNYRVCVKDGRNCIEYKGWRVLFGGDYKLIAPVRLFNPYVKNGSCELTDYLLAVNIYPEGDRLEVTFEKINEDNKIIFYDDSAKANAVISAE